MDIVAVGQICSTGSLADNLAQCREMASQAAHAGAKALFLPEAADYIAPTSAESIELAVPIHQSPFVLGLQEEARKHHLAINVGVHEPASAPNGKKLKNTLLWIDENGEITHRYQKLHLFDMDLSAGPNLKESDSVEAGNTLTPPFTPTTFDSGNDATPASIGMMICFDLRFPLLSSTLRSQGANILTYPSAFTIPTGSAGHWEILLRARAIENQCFVIAAAQVGRHSAKRASYGHSMIVDPWGRILAEAPGFDDDDDNSRGIAQGVKPSLITAELDMSILNDVRRRMVLKPRTDVI